jgi:alkylation response protein AidB-like acyl-CoA dehydrogenase
LRIEETEDQALLREAIRTFVEHEAPVEKVDAWEAGSVYPAELFAALAEQGYLALPFDESVGGSGYGAVEMAIVGEELAKPGLDVAGGYGLTVFAGLNVVRHGSPELVRTHLPAMLDGRERYALGITEPDAGSDVAGIKTSAKRTDAGYVINGQKVFTTGAAIPGTLIHVLARTGAPGRGHDGLSVFMVPNDAPGLEMRRLHTVGRHMLGTYETFYDGVEVPESALLGEEGQGWDVVSSSLELERVFAAAQYAGAAHATLGLTAAYVNEREQFGRRLGAFQSVAHRLADVLVQVESARLLAYRAATLVDAGQPANTDAAIAKLAASHAFQEAADAGMQFFGGYGYMTEYRIERHWREARVTTITSGASEIQRSIIAKDLLRGSRLRKAVAA